uniref:Proteasome subunit beta n=1 Tax=Eutreptiella gymnastica TaxID=73025 RepID=A0A7S1I6I0_9EUGL|mmetsp:Transcript_132930/g.230513  ORF Transcript_132930/g.230513 Transcript_132930/m.230513 type:complete len:224 (+) Transcript_132930:34-705(+)
MASGSSVVALKYKDGVLLATDTLLSYGSLARYPAIQRIKVVGEYTAVAASGDYADFQSMAGQMDDLLLEDILCEDYCTLGPKEVFSWLTRVMYNRRCEFNPLLNTAVVAGYRDGKAFCGFVDSVGTHFEVTDCVATGMASYVGLPLLRKRCEENPDMSKEKAIEIIEEVMKVQFYRDCRTINKIIIADCNASGVEISPPKTLDTEWKYKLMDFEHTKLITLPC